MKLLVTAEGSIRCLYAEAIDLSTLGRQQIQRASQVEPTPDGRWLTDLAPVRGPRLGPFDTRSQALAEEISWLEQHWLAAGS